MKLIMGFPINQSQTRNSVKTNHFFSLISSPIEYILRFLATKLLRYIVYYYIQFICVYIFFPNYLEKWWVFFKSWFFFSLPFMHTYKDVYFVACRDPFEIDLSFGVTFFQIPWFGQNDVYTFDPALASCKFKKSTPTVI